MMDEREVLWVAGLLEGEGSFYTTVPVPRNGYVYPHIKLAMTDQDIVERFAKIVGGKVHSSKWGKTNHKLMYYCNVPQSRLLEVAKAIRPHMGIRRTAQIDKILALPPRVGHLGEHNSRHKLTTQAVLEIRATPKGPQTITLARRFGVQCQTINRVRRRGSWRCVT